MSLLSIQKDYKSGDILLEADLDAFIASIETFLNTTKLNNDNIAATSITGSTKLAAASVSSGKLSSNAASSDKIEASAVTLSKLTSSLLSFFCPAGITMAYGGTSAPTGWLLCDGSAVSRTTYADLFTVIGETHGSGDGSTTFNLPDYRGRFLRMVDGDAGRDPNKAARTIMATGGAAGNSAGSVQADSYKAHNHSPSDSGHTHTAEQETAGGGSTLFSSDFDPFFPGTPTVNTSAGVGASYTGPIDAATTGISLQNSGGDETRPLNANVNWIIRT